MKKIKKYFGELLTIIGTGIFINYVFRFSSVRDFNSGGGFSLTEHQGSGGVAYYYPDDIILWLTIGSVLIITGLLIIKNRTIK
jgi:hypothetical protein